MPYRRLADQRAKLVSHLFKPPNGGLFCVLSIFIRLKHRTVVLKVINDLRCLAVELERKLGVLCEHSRGPGD